MDRDVRQPHPFDAVLITEPEIDAPGVEYSFKYFQQVEGEIVLPPGFQPLRISVRYQFVYQDGVDDGSLPVAFPSYMRNTVMITVGAVMVL